MTKVFTFFMFSYLRSYRLKAPDTGLTEFKTITPPISVLIFLVPYVCYDREFRRKFFCTFSNDRKVWEPKNYHVIHTKTFRGVENIYTYSRNPTWAKQMSSSGPWAFNWRVAIKFKWGQWNHCPKYYGIEIYKWDPHKNPSQSFDGRHLTVIAHKKFTNNYLHT